MVRHLSLMTSEADFRCSTGSPPRAQHLHHNKLAPFQRPVHHTSFGQSFADIPYTRLAHLVLHPIRVVEVYRKTRRNSLPSQHQPTATFPTSY